MNHINDAKLVDAVRRAANRHSEDKIEIFTGIVTDNSLAFDEGVISVKQITGKNISSVNPIDDDYTSSTIPNEFNQNFVDRDGLVFDNVEIQATPGDYNFVIPAVGSYVRVVYSTLQDPFIIQMSDVDAIHNSIGVTQFTMNDNSMVISASMSSHVISETGHLFTVGEGAQVTTLEQKNNSFDLKVNNGGEIKIDTKLTMKNQLTSMLEIMQNLVTNLNTGANSGGTVVFATDPGFTALLVKINGLLGS